mmetsp:Transcript_62402/g.146325  ORF Transcript_62402/g.146325 Transcript_62402/m.146325 type:complete len:255 (+) Transcript_62402:631-1395(+)
MPHVRGLEHGRRGRHGRRGQGWSGDVDHPDAAARSPALGRGDRRGASLRGPPGTGREKHGGCGGLGCRWAAGPDCCRGSFSEALPSTSRRLPARAARAAQRRLGSALFPGLPPVGILVPRGVRLDHGRQGGPGADELAGHLPLPAGRARLPSSAAPGGLERDLRERGGLGCGRRVGDCGRHGRGPAAVPTTEGGWPAGNRASGAESLRPPPRHGPGVCGSFGCDRRRGPGPSPEHCLRNARDLREEGGPLGPEV